MKHEIEAKFLSVDKDAMRTKLKNAGFALEASEFLMRRKTFDLPSAAGRRWGRVRQESGRITMTVKEVRRDAVDGTFEAEVGVDDFDAACAIFEACGFPAKSSQENRREAWARGGVEATIDTWPGLRPFVEIEGPDETAVRTAAAELGFRFDDALFGPVNPVYERELGIPAEEISRLAEITFAHPPRKWGESPDDR